MIKILSVSLFLFLVCKEIPALDVPERKKSFLYEATGEN